MIVGAAGALRPRTLRNNWTGAPLEEVETAATLAVAELLQQHGRRRVGANGSVGGGGGAFERGMGDGGVDNFGFLMVSQVRLEARPPPDGRLLPGGHYACGSALAGSLELWPQTRTPPPTPPPTPRSPLAGKTAPEEVLVPMNGPTDVEITLAACAPLPASPTPSPSPPPPPSPLPASPEPPLSLPPIPAHPRLPCAPLPGWRIRRPAVRLPPTPLPMALRRGGRAADPALLALAPAYPFVCPLRLKGVRRRSSLPAIAPFDTSP